MIWGHTNIQIITEHFRNHGHAGKLFSSCYSKRLKLAYVICIEWISVGFPFPIFHFKTVGFAYIYAAKTSNFLASFAKLDIEWSFSGYHRVEMVGQFRKSIFSVDVQRGKVG